MKMSSILRRITVYPIKSLDGVSVDEVHVLPSGALANDRRFALVAAGGRYVNGKSTAAVQRIRAEYNLAAMTVRFDGTDEFSLLDDRAKIGAWLRTALGITCVLNEDIYRGFPDDAEAPGPTLVSTATLEAVASWFPGMSLDEARRRFRANLEFDGVEPFWEDRLVGPAGAAVRFTIGDVAWLGVNPCQRCVVPTRDALTGETDRGFQKTFAERRRAALPAWAPAERFDHFYRLAVNTKLATGDSPGRLRVGDAITFG
jgi:uncharacterized protein YcbX